MHSVYQNAAYFEAKMKYPGMFRDYDGRVGKAWLKQVDTENRKVFGRIGYDACGQKRGFAYLPKTGGCCRAKSAQRDHRGRFIKRP